jgi:multiple sugar transport system substrate-binding protein
MRNFEVEARKRGDCFTRAKIKKNAPSRRDFLKLGAAAVALGPYFSFPDRARASQPTLKIAKWAHFVPEFDPWFDGMAKDWARQHNMNITVDHISVEDVHAIAKTEIKAAKGHDLFMFPWPPAEFQEHVIDHAEIYQVVAAKYGNLPQLGFKSTFNLKTKKYFAFADSWIPAPFNYLENYWRDEADMPLGPVTYGSLRIGAQKIRAKTGVSCGLAFTPTLEGNITAHTLLYAFGSSLLDPAGKRVLINSGARTIEALKYVKALSQDAGTPEQFTWGPLGNVRAMLGRKASCTINGISLVRAAEKQNRDLAKDVRLSPPLLGSNGVTALPHVTSCSVVWNFAENKEGAKQFLGDLIDSSRAVYEQSQGCNFPIYQKTVPNLIVRLQEDSQADPPGKYTELKDALHWTPNLGAPGLANPVMMEAFNSFVIPRMFTSVVKGDLTPEEAARAAETEITNIFEKWNPSESMATRA